MRMIMNWRHGLSLITVVVAEMALTKAVAGELPPREPLDALWEEHMLKGETEVISIEIRDSQNRIQRTRGAMSPTDWPEMAAFAPHGIIVVQLGEGLFRLGGWRLKGGLLGRSTDGSLTVDLYEKVVVHQLPHVPRPWDYDPPYEKGYEFFLLQRKSGVSGATIVQRWMFPPEAVPDVIRYGKYGPTIERVQAKLHYHSSTAVVTITGLKNPFEERIDLSSQIGAVDQ